MSEIFRRLFWLYMKLPTQAIEEFKNIWEQATGVVLNSQEASVQAQKFLTGLEAIFNNQSNFYADTQSRTPVPTPNSLLKNKEPRLENEALHNMNQ